MPEPTITLHTLLTEFHGVGPTRAAALAKLGLHTTADLLAYFPRDYEDRTLRESIAVLPPDAPAAVSALIAEPLRTSYLRPGMEVTKGRAVDHTGQLDLTFFNQSYVRRALHPGQAYVFYGQVTGVGLRRQMTNPRFEPEGKGELTGGITPVYPLSAGISQNFLLSLLRTALPACPDQIEDPLPPALQAEHHLIDAPQAYRSIHLPATWEDLQAARRRLMFEELFCLNLGLTYLRTRRECESALPFPNQDLSALTGSLPFQLTQAQRRAIDEAAADLRKPTPMSRLLQGDVGSGKTVVAAACALFAYQNGCQAAFMAPTELLAHQHQATLETLLRQAGLRIALLIGSMTTAQKRQTTAALAAGEIDLVVGTHALLSEGVQFARLGLVITDEQHRFGVGQRAALAAKSGGDLHPHVLVMSATPIPRTLALMLYGDLDLSLLNELPPGRTPVETYLIHENKRPRLYNFVRKQVALGRQVYIVCPAVSQEDPDGLKAAEQYGHTLQTEVFPDLRVGIVHGKQRSKEKQAVMSAFAAGDLDVLVSTTVIEVGVDVPNASLMVIENADRFGLSQLHQLRGRVGRGTHQSYCVLLSDNENPQTRQRLKTLAATTDGFALAEADLKQRGPGDFFGTRQTGLPQLRLATLEGDLTLLQEAQTAARQTIQADPTLTRPDHQALRRRISALFQEKGEIFNCRTEKSAQKSPTQKTASGFPIPIEL